MREVKTDTVNFSLNLADCSPAVTNVVMQTLQNTFDSLRKVIETDKEEQRRKRLRIIGNRLLVKNIFLLIVMEMSILLFGLKIKQIKDAMVFEMFLEPKKRQNLR